MITPLEPASLSKVPNAPCGVERSKDPSVETPEPQVPNAPCGVESGAWRRCSGHSPSVPNAPCGVESCGQGAVYALEKDIVPNAPCGVESGLGLFLRNLNY